MRLNKHDMVAGGSMHTNTTLGRGITLGRGETMELIHFQWCFYTILICYTFWNVYLSIFYIFGFLFCFSECGMAQLRSKHVVG